MGTATFVGVTNLVLGTVYTCYGLMTAVELKRGWRTRGFSHFGTAWLAMAFTCGPHHLDHGLHVLLAGRAGGPLDLVTILVGFPVGVLWFLLRVEAMMGGRGERTIDGTPRWLVVLPVVGASYVAAVATAGQSVLAGAGPLSLRAVPNVVLVFLYAGIGAVLLHTQVRNHQVTGQWSVSGLSLGLVMNTCAVMHGVFVAYATDGRYDLDWHGSTIDIVGVPAAAYFLWVTYALSRGWLRDWNEPEAGEAGMEVPTVGSTVAVAIGAVAP